MSLTKYKTYRSISFFTLFFFPLLSLSVGKNFILNHGVILSILNFALSLTALYFWYYFDAHIVKYTRNGLGFLVVAIGIIGIPYYLCKTRSIGKGILYSIGWIFLSLFILGEYQTLCEKITTQSKEEFVQRLEKKLSTPFCKLIKNDQKTKTYVLMSMPECISKVKADIHVCASANMDDLPPKITLEARNEEWFKQWLSVVDKCIANMFFENHA